MKRKTKRIIITAALSSLCLIIGFIASYYIYGILGAGELSAKYERELENYKTEYGANCYVLLKDVKEGDEVKDSDFKTQQLPTSLNNEELLEDISLVEGARYSRPFKKNSVVYKDMFYNLKDLPGDLRSYEINVLNLPKNIEEKDYVDIRISFPSGLDYVVLSKKRIEKLIRVEDKPEEKPTASFMLTSEEILRLSSALVDAYLTNEALLYTTSYVSAHNQEAAEITYPSNEAVQQLMREDPNVVLKAKIELEGAKRKLLNSSLVSYNESEQLQLISGVKSDISGYETDLKDSVENKEEQKKSGKSEGIRRGKSKHSDKKEETIDISNTNSID